MLLTVVPAVDWALATYTRLAFATMVLVWLKGFKVIDDKTRSVAVVDRYLKLLKPLTVPA